MCMSQMCQEITAASSQHNPLMTVRCACVQLFNTFLPLSLFELFASLISSSEQKSYIYTFLTRLDLFLRKREALTVSVIM